MNFVRHTAVRVWVSDLHNSQYARQDNSLNFIELSDGRKAFRIAIMGLVVNLDESVWVDDGTGSVSVKTFDGNLPDVDVGSFVFVIGRPREFSSQKYVLGEILKPVDKKWFEFWQKTVDKAAETAGVVVEDAPVNVDVVSIVRDLDSGEGADYDSVAAKIGDGAEDKILHLLAIGELFETKPGKLKVLE